MVGATIRFCACVAVLALSLPAAPEERLTQRCNSNWGNGEVIVYAHPDAMRILVEAANSPSTDPDLYERLWRPQGARLSGNGSFVALQYERIQDTSEIASALKADARVAGMLPYFLFADSEGVCFAALPPAEQVPVTEFFNVQLGHYFLSSSAAETQAIEAGAAGPGWQRTGSGFGTIKPGYCYESRPVFRFYGARQNSHFFTVDADECGSIRRNDPGWQYEGEAFGALAPVAGACPRGTPVLRLYNGRWAQDDSNHRFTQSPATYSEMQRQGWIGEGVAFCIDDRYVH